MKKTYSEKLRDPRWQKRRLEALESHNFTCTECRSKDKTLHVHHRRYIKGREPWEYDALIDLDCLCEDCHSTREELLAYAKDILSRMDNNELEWLNFIFKEIRCNPWSIANIGSFIQNLSNDIKMVNGIEDEEEK